MTAITQYEYSHYLTMCLCWLLVHTRGGVWGEFSEAPVHGDLCPTGTVMVNA